MRSNNRPQCWTVGPSNTPRLSRTWQVIKGICICPGQGVFASERKTFERPPVLDRSNSPTHPAVWPEPSHDRASLSTPGSFLAPRRAVWERGHHRRLLPRQGPVIEGRARDVRALSCPGRLSRRSDGRREPRLRSAWRTHHARPKNSTPPRTFRERGSGSGVSAGPASVYVPTPPLPTPDPKREHGSAARFGDI